jgi:hypothetical protein
MSSEKNRKACCWFEGDENLLKYLEKKILEIVLNLVLKQMETEILEFPLSHQYNNKT